VPLLPWQVLSMVDGGLLETGGVSPLKLCLVAVAYHNRGVELALKVSPSVHEAIAELKKARALFALCPSEASRYAQHEEESMKWLLHALVLTPEVKAVTKGLANTLIFDSISNDFFAET
jgi:hypothetical protein